MPKHRFRESIRSFFGSHIDSDGKHDQIKKEKEDIDSKVEKILELINDEESDGRNENFQPNSQKEPLLALVNEFRAHYNNLYSHYDDITEELKKVHGKHDKDNSSSSSSSSDSESEYSSKGRGSKNGKLSDSLKLELEAAYQKVGELQEKLTATNEENNALRSRLHDVNIEVEELRFGIGKLDEEKAKLAAENDELGMKVNNLSMEADDLIHRLEEVNNEKETLTMDTETDKRAIKEGEKTIADLNMKADRLEEENRIAISELEAVKSLLASAQQEAADLSHSQQMAAQENSSLSLQISELSDELNQAKSTIQEMIAESGQMKEHLSDREIVLSTLTTAHETHKNESSNQITNLNAQVQSLELDLNSLTAQKTELEAHLDGKITELEQLTEQRSMLLAQVTELEQRSNEKGEEIAGLTQKLEENELSSAAKIQDLTNRVESLQFEVENVRSKKVEVEEQFEQKIVEASEQVKNLMDQIELMRSELDSVCKQKNVLEEHLEARIIDINQLKEENKTTQAKVSEMEKALTVREEELSALQKSFEDRDHYASAQIFSLTEQTNLLQARNIDLQNLLESKTNDASDQIKGFTDQITAMQQELESLEKHKNESESEVARKSQEIAGLMIALEALKEELGSKTGDHQRALEDRESMIAVMKDLELQVDSLSNLRSELEEQVAKLTAEVSQHVDEKNGLNEKLCHVENALAERDSELSDILNKLEEEMGNESHQITTLTAELENLRVDFDSLRTQKEELEMQAENEKQVVSQSLSLSEGKIMDLMNTIKDLEFAVNEKDTAIVKLTEEYKQVKDLLEESQDNHKALERKMEETTGELQRNIESKDRVIADLEKLVDTLKEDLEMKVDELKTVTENVRNIEVKLRLTNQKLRVTEQLQIQNEEIRKTAEQKCKELEERVATLSAAIYVKDEAHQKMVSGISDNVNKTMTGVESILRSFEEQHQKFVNSISEVTGELKIAKDWVAATNHEKSQIEGKLRIRDQQLQDKAARELAMKNTVEQLEGRLQMEEGERAKLSAMAGELKKSVGEYEALLKEKDDCILGMGEEKIEAIRQLCIWIDYERERCDYLKDMITKMRPVRGGAQRGA